MSIGSPENRDGRCWLSAARLRGFEEDLGLLGNQYPTILSILYVGYIAMQVPSYAFRS